MAIVTYKCNTCKRTIDLIRNTKGLEQVGRCVITHGCRGSLYQTKLLPDFVRGQLPDKVVGLDDWKQRKVLHNHVQSIQRDSWVIVHGMGVIPIVSVFVDRPLEGDLNNREEITPQDIEIVDDNSLILHFDRAWSGISQLVARQSDPDLLRPAIQVTTTEATNSQISSNGELSVATRIGTVGDNGVISLNVRYLSSTSGFPTSVTYAVDDQPSINSAWNNYDRVIIKGKIYTVRSFNGLITEMTTGVIGAGSTFEFLGIDPNGADTFQDIKPLDVLLLMATSPYETVDKITSSFIDVTSVSDTLNPNGFFYNNGEFFADTSIIQKIYPTIRSV